MQVTENYVSPYVRAAFDRCQTPVKATTIPATQFILYALWPREVRLRSVEYDLIETASEALEAVKQLDHIVQVIRVDNDAPPRDVSEDIARAWFNQIEPGDSIPAFVALHISADDRADMLSEDYSMARAAE